METQVETFDASGEPQIDRQPIEIDVEAILEELLAEVEVEEEEEEEEEVEVDVAAHVDASEYDPELTAAVEALRKWGLTVTSTAACLAQYSSEPVETIRTLAASVPCGCPKPTIWISLAETRVVDEILAELAERDPDLYVSRGVLVQLVGASLGELSAGVVPSIKPVELMNLRERITRALGFAAIKELKPLSRATPTATITNRGGSEVRILATRIRLEKSITVQEVMARRHWPMLRELRGIATSPLLRPDGTVLDVAGYDVDSALFYAPPADVTFPPVRDPPSDGNAKAAAEVLLSLVPDFPFATPADKSAWLSAVLTMFARAALPVKPLHLFQGSVSASGKGLLVHLIGMMERGAGYPPSKLGKDDAETTKQIVARAVEGAEVILFDNIKEGVEIGGATLEALITEGRISERILGGSTTITGAYSPVMCATANNPRVSVDMVRRIVSCRLEPPVERPEERELPDVLAEVEADRGAFVHAALTILRWQVARGCPTPKKALSDFRAYDRLVRGAIVGLGYADPLDTRKTLRAHADDTTEAVRALIGAWDRLGADGKGEVLATRMVEVAVHTAALHEPIGVLTHCPLAHLSADRLSRALGRVRGRVVDVEGEGPCRLVSRKTMHGTAWSVEIEREGTWAGRRPPPPPDPRTM